MQYILTGSKKNEPDELGATMIEMLKEDRKSLDGVDGFLIQAGEIIRRVKSEDERTELQLEILIFMNNKVREYNANS